MVRDTGVRAKTKPATSTLVDTKTIRNTGLANSNGAQAVGTKDNTSTTSRKDMEKCTGKMAAYTVASGMPVSNQGLVS